MESSGVFKGLFYGGFASCVAEVFTMPVDVVKTRMQYSGAGGKAEYSGALDASKQIVRKEGVRALWKGLPPALLRQSTYGSLRYGLYGPIKNSLGIDPKKPVPLTKKIVAGAGAGAVASVIANPTDLIKIRMQIDGMGGTASRYSGLLQAFRSVVVEEGVLGLWKGVGPTCGRATVLAAAELASYDEIKGKLQESGAVSEGLGLHLCSSLSSGFIATVASSPFDVVKSRVMGQPTGPDGKGTLYRGMIDCFVKTGKNEGPLSLWKGFWPNFGRVGPRVVIVFVVMEQLKKHLD